MRDLILASGSPHRAQLLSAAGIEFDQQVSKVDENTLKKGREINTLAGFLAEAKARDVSTDNRDALVLGADQVLLCEGRTYDKPRNMEEAKAHLLLLRGKTHTLETALSLVRNGEEIWSHLARPKLTMRSFSDDFVATYCDRAGDIILTSVGAYQIEGLGAQLFDTIEGDTFSIQGLPLIPLLKFLREQGLVSK